MAHQWQVGQKAVAKRTVKPRFGHPGVVKGEVVVVEGITTTSFHPKLVFLIVKGTKPGINSNHFEPIVAADAEFTQRMRALLKKEEMADA